MNSWIRRARTSAIGLAVAAAIVTGGVVQGASADTTPAQTPTATPAQTSTPTPASAPSSAPDAGVDANPSLEAQNAARNHVLGATLPDGASSDAPAFTPTSGVLGFDISRFQGPNVDFASAYSAGARFVYIKASESYNSTNDYFTQQWQGAGATNLIRGTYHFADPFESSGAVQAAFYVAHGGTWTPDGKTLPPVLDVETNTYGAVDGDECWSKSPAQLTAWVNDFSSTMLAQTGVRPTIYTNATFWSHCMDGSTGFSANPLFFATRDLTSPGALPASWSNWSFWQYAEHPASSAFPGDQDVFNGTAAQLTVFAKHATPDSNYVAALYEDYLTRYPGPTESAGWESNLAAGAPRSTVAGGFVQSDEYRLIRIDAAYTSVLGRAAEPGGRASWLSAMHSGAITTDDIETSLYASDEYYNHHGGNDTGFVDSLYSALLHRTGTPSDYAFWTNLIRQHGRAWVIAQFWDSNETISERVSAMYQLYLGRVPDPSGLQGWVNVALQIGDSGLRSGFTSSDEYYNRSQTRTF